MRHRRASLASLFDSLCERNAVTHNTVRGVQRPRAESGEGRTPALGDHQARKLLAAPDAGTLKSKRDRAVLSTLLFHALRRDELCNLTVRDFRHARKGVSHLRISGKGGKTRYVPLHPGTHALIHEYLEVAGHGADESGALFRPVRNNRTGNLAQAITPDGCEQRWCDVVVHHRATIATSRLSNTAKAADPGIQAADATASGGSLGT